MVLVEALVAASDDGEIRPIPILIPIPSGGSGGSVTGRSDYCGGTVGDSYISPFSEV